MIDYKHFPKNAVLLKEISKRITDVAVRQSLNRYTYRYRLANAFNGLDVTGIDKRTLRGYSAATKLFLAYTAYDEVRVAEKILLDRKNPKLHHVFNFPLAHKIRRNKGLERLQKNSSAVTRESLTKSVAKFYDEGNNEIMCIATAIRNCFAHGDLTAGGADLDTVKAQVVVEELADAVMQKSNEIFNEILGQK